MNFLQKKYGREFIYNEVCDIKNMSLTFRDIWQCRAIDKIHNLVSPDKFTWKVCNGLKVKF